MEYWYWNFGVLISLLYVSFLICILEESSKFIGIIKDVNRLLLERLFDLTITKCFIYGSLIHML